MEKKIKTTLVVVSVVVIIIAAVLIVIFQNHDGEQGEKIELVGYIKKTSFKATALSDFQLSNITTIGDYERKSLLVSSSINLSTYENKKVRVFGEIMEVEYPEDLEHPYQIMGTIQTYIVIENIEMLLISSEDEAINYTKSNSEVKEFMNEQMGSLSWDSENSTIEAIYNETENIWIATIWLPKDRPFEIRLTPDYIITSKEYIGP